MSCLQFIMSGIKRITTAGVRTMPVYVKRVLTMGANLMKPKPMSQKDPRWASLKYAKTSRTVGEVGCLITCLAMMCGRTPKEVNALLNSGGGFTSTGLVRHAVAAKILGLRWSGVSYNLLYYPKYITVMETNHFSPKYPQHFCLWMNDGQKIIDPIDGKLKENHYGIVGWRLYSA